MSSFMFEPEDRPFPQWSGPFSPARGKHSGFRFHQGRLGTWVEGQFGSDFWPVIDGQGERGLADVVRSEWGGGRVLFLPNGFVVKPLPGSEEAGRRLLIGRFSGTIVLERPNGSQFDLAQPGRLQPGDPWPGPTTTGLECTIDSGGSLTCQWYEPTAWGRDETSEQLSGSDRTLAAGFRKARPHETNGRVRVTAHGHVITNRQEWGTGWTSYYVGSTDPSSWSDWQEWIRRTPCD